MSLWCFWQINWDSSLKGCFVVWTIAEEQEVGCSSTAFQVLVILECCHWWNGHTKLKRPLYLVFCFRLRIHSVSCNRKSWPVAFKRSFSFEQCLSQSPLSLFFVCHEKMKCMNKSLPSLMGSHTLTISMTSMNMCPSLACLCPTEWVSNTK